MSVQSTKRVVDVIHDGKSHSVAWFPGTPWQAIEDVVRRSCGLAPDEQFLLRDLADHSAVALSEFLPPGARFVLELPPSSSPARPVQSNSIPSEPRATELSPEDLAASLLFDEGAAIECPASGGGPPALQLSDAASPRGTKRAAADLQPPQSATRQPSEAKPKKSRAETPTTTVPTTKAPRAMTTAAATTSSGAPPLPPVRWGASVTPIGDSSALLYGGDSTECTRGDLWVLDGVSGAWSRLETSVEAVPRAWSSATFVPDQHLVFIFGGERSDERGVTENMDLPMVLDTEVLLWFPPVCTGTPPRPRSGHSASLIGREIVIWGGCSGRKWSNDTFALNIETWMWRNARPSGRVPSARTYHTATALQDSRRVVFFGGNDDVRSFNDVHVLDATGQGTAWGWSQPVMVGEPPAPRTGHMAVLLGDGRILIHGGWDPKAEGDEDAVRFSDAYVLDPVAWTWTRASQDTGVYLVGHRGVIVGADLVVVGGSVPPGVLISSMTLPLSKFGVPASSPSLRTEA